MKWKIRFAVNSNKKEKEVFEMLPWIEIYNVAMEI
jgi:hypothetical protein